MSCCSYGFKHPCRPTSYAEQPTAEAPSLPPAAQAWRLSLRLAPKCSVLGRSPAQVHQQVVELQATPTTRTTYELEPKMLAFRVFRRAVDSEAPTRARGRSRASEGAVAFTVFRTAVASKPPTRARGQLRASQRAFNGVYSLPEGMGTPDSVCNWVHTSPQACLRPFVQRTIARSILVSSPITPASKNA